MIVSASCRTDIPAHYGRWFRNRLAAGYARAVNPFGGQVYSVDLRPEAVDGFVFWTRNARPFHAALEEVAAAGVPFVVQYTVTGAPRSLEPGVIAPAAAVADIRALAERYGPRAVVWRYDPVLLTDHTPPDVHRARMAELAGALAGAVDEVVLSFARIYRKTRRNLDRSGLAWSDPPAADKQALLADLAQQARDHGLTPTLCSQPELLAEVPGLTAARCIDAGRLGDVAGRAVAAPVKGGRPGCLCARTRDIGAYDTCAQGCVYCYAVSSRERARPRLAAHDPDSPFLQPDPPAGR